jgi:hypothetical protein
MKNASVALLFALLFNSGLLKAQDTMLLKDNSKVACVVTTIYSNKVEYVKFGDSLRKQYYTYPKKDIQLIRYANGSIDTFELLTGSMSKTDSFANDGIAYARGFADGYKGYKPTTERLVGAGAVIFAYVGILAPIGYSMAKVQANNIREEKFHNSKNNNYRRGYLDGASKRRRVAVWSAYGITAGAVVVGATALLVIAFSGY